MVMLQHAEHTSLSRPPLSVLFLDNSHAGHVRQGLGILKALERRFALTVHRIKPRNWISPQLPILPALVARKWIPPKLLFAFLYPKWVYRMPPYDLIVGATVAWHPFGILLRRIHGVHYVTARTMLPYEPDDFSAIFRGADEFDHPAALQVPIPPPIDFGIRPPPSRFTARSDFAGRTLGIALGGPIDREPWGMDDWRGMAGLARAAERLGFVVSVSTSRRTPPEARALFAGLHAERPFAQFIDYGTAGLGSIDAMMAGSDCLIVTGDSQTMVAETWGTGRPVLVLSRQEKRHQRRTTVLGKAMADGSVGILPATDWTEDGLAEGILKLAPIGYDPQERLLELLLPKIGLGHHL